MFDISWENKIYKKGKQINLYPYDWVVSSSFKFLKKKTIALEIGCGSGNNLGFLNDFGFNKIVGLDGSKSACEFAKKKFKKFKNIEIFNENFNLFNYEINKYDLILDRGSLTHNKIVNIESTIKNIYHGLKKKAYFFSSIFSNDHFYSTKSKDQKSFSFMTKDGSGVMANFFSEKEVKKLYSNFKLIELSKQVREIKYPVNQNFSMWNIICQKE